MIAERTDRFGRLVRLLKELFQLDKPDLDFGFYRIMHAKEAEVTRFLEVDLLPQVKDAFQQYRSADRATLEQQLAEAQRDARGLGFDPAAAPRVQELRKAIDAGTDVDALEADVYDHLYRFFRRYYSEGDFISQRVYKDGVYAIPYQGEEVKLHWANADQYYIKTTEYLKDYSFRLRPEAESDPMRVHFRLADAAEGEHGNIKAADEKARRFVLLAGDFVAEEEGSDGVRELVIRFEYRAATLGDWPRQKQKGRKRPPQQKDLNEAAATAVLNANDLSLARWMKELAATHVKADGTPADYSCLRSHLDRYTARNTYDYFIHKDLGGFLRRELDFYVKNEVMRLDDIEHESAPRVEEWLSKIKVIRAIAHKIIDFLAQLEGFQKKLWLKKKFVVETSWCIRVGCIPDEFLAEIAANDAQRAEWVDFCGIDTIEGDLTGVGYTNPLTPEFVRHRPTLMVDTRHFSDRFVDALLAAFDDLDGITDGVLVHSENFQALNWMTERYRERMDCIYIDPPYNTSENTFVYKNSYKHSSWAAMMMDRLALARLLLPPDGVLECAIDDAETWRLRAILDNVFGSGNRVSTIVSQVNPAGQNLRPNTPALSHDYCHIYALDIDRMTMASRKLTGAEKQAYRFEDAKGRFLWDNLRRRGGNSRPADRPGQWFPLYVDEKQKTVSVDRFDGAREVWPIDPKGERRIWRSNPNGTRRDIGKGEIGVIEKAGRVEVVKKSRMPQGRKPKTLWPSPRYSATTFGTKLLNDVIGEQRFSYPKSLHLVTECLRYWSDPTATVLDFFAGSGTTVHAVIELNREDGGQRKVVCVEMGDHFDTVLLPRVKKVTFSPEWKNGRPAVLAKPREAERSPRIVKVVRLESYEDTLNNLVVRRPVQVQRLLDENTDGGPNGAREDYIIRYMLDVETGDSPSLLDLSAFLDPSAYRLKVKLPGSDESREVAVDLVETFNWLLGLRVIRMSAAKRYDAEFDDAGPSNSTVTVASKETPDGPWWFRTVEGLLPDDRRALVIWRHRPGGDQPDGIERDNAVLDEWFKQSGHHARQADYDLIYANGDHSLDSLKETGQTWTGHTIEEHFKRLMFEDAEERAEPW